MDGIKSIIDELLNDDIIKIVISNKMNSTIEYNKIIINLKEKTCKNNCMEEFYQVEKFTDKQVFHENVKPSEIKNKLIELLNNSYKQIQGWSKSNVFDIKISKKGKIHISKKASNNEKIEKKSHNKEKNYILKEGTIIEPLIDLGIFTREGKIINSKYDKFKQINRFIEMVDDEIKKQDLNELTVLDFGCGKSYLTFVLYYYFTKIKNIKVKMIGLDLKQDVIKKCNDIALRYGYDDLKFELGDINGYKYNNKVDMVITLHACDIATDYALYNAIKWNAKMIFSVPCCQHEFNKQIEPQNLNIISRYGIIQERVSALLTDAVRGNLLEIMGYRTQLLEFIDISHSPKNILIRASKGKVSSDKCKKLKQEVTTLMQELSLEPTLYTLLKKDDLI